MALLRLSFILAFILEFYNPLLDLTVTKKLRKTAEDAIKIGISAPGNASIIIAVLEILDTLYFSIQQIDQAIKDLIQQEQYILNNITLLQSIPRIGPQISITIVSEIGDFSLFKKPKQLVAYFGLDPTQRQSGTFVGSKNKLSKRGSSYVRSALHMAAVSAVVPHRQHPAPNPVLHAFYEKKRAVKPGQVAMCAVMHKICNIIFAVLRDQKPFELRQPEHHAQKLMLVTAA